MATIYQFRVGDRVRVRASVLDCSRRNELGLYIPEQMEEYLGCTTRILSTYDFDWGIGYYLECDADKWIFSALELSPCNGKHRHPKITSKHRRCATNLLAMQSMGWTPKSSYLLSLVNDIIHTMKRPLSDDVSEIYYGCRAELDKFVAGSIYRTLFGGTLYRECLGRHNKEWAKYDILWNE